MTTPMKTATKAARPILLSLLLALPGCFGLNRGAPAPQHYVLDADGAARGAAAVAPPVAGAAEPVMIGLRPLRLAEYLASPLIVVRQGTHRVGFSEFHRWGENLARGVSRTLARRMAARSPAHRLEPAPWPAGAGPEYLVQLDLLRFEGVVPPGPEASTGEAHLLATWEILGSGSEAVLASGTTEVRSGGWTVGDYDGLVSLLDVGLDRLVDDLALALEQVIASAEATDLP